VRPFQLATAVAFIALAAVVMFDTRAGALVDRTGRSPGGIGAGFYPFWAAAVLGFGGLVVGYQTLSGRLSSASVFAERDGILSVFKLVGPMIVATAALAWLGLYVVMGLYMAYFARVIGGYRWYWVALIAVVFPFAIYLAFEVGFRVRLPKSVFYVQGLPF
jgi:hypothetical protein